MARLIAATSLIAVLLYLGTSASVQLFAPAVQPANLRLPAQRFAAPEPMPIYATTQGEPPRSSESANVAPILAFMASFTAVASLASAGRNSRNISMMADGADPYVAVKNVVDSAPVAMISKTTCPFCKKAKQALDMIGCTSYEVIEIDELPVEEMQEIQSAMAVELGSRTVPKVFFKGELLGGCDDTLAALKSGRLKELCAAAGA
jgi:glutaredoxin 3